MKLRQLFSIPLAATLALGTSTTAVGLHIPKVGNGDASVEIGTNYVSSADYDYIGRFVDRAVGRSYTRYFYIEERSSNPSGQVVSGNFRERPAQGKGECRGRWTLYVGNTPDTYRLEMKYNNYQRRWCAVSGQSYTTLLSEANLNDCYTQNAY